MKWFYSAGINYFRLLRIYEYMRFALAHDWLSFDFSYSRLHLCVWISFGEMYTRDGLFVMFQTLSRTPFQSDNAMAVVGTRHNNLVTPVSLTPSHTPYMLSISHIQPCWCDVQMALFVWVVETTKLDRERERENEGEKHERENRVDLSRVNACTCVCESQCERGSRKKDGVNNAGMSLILIGS